MQARLRSSPIGRYPTGGKAAVKRQGAEWAARIYKCRIKSDTRRRIGVWQRLVRIDARQTGRLAFPQTFGGNYFP